MEEPGMDTTETFSTIGVDMAATSAMVRFFEWKISGITLMLGRVGLQWEGGDGRVVMGGFAGVVCGILML